MMTQRKFSYVLGSLFVLIMLFIMIGISVFLINRTNSTLIEIYWKQGELVVESIAISAQQTIDTVSLTQHQVERNLHKIAQKVEQLRQKAAPDFKTSLEDLAESRSIYGLTLYNLDGSSDFNIHSEYYLRKTDDDRNDRLGVEAEKYPREYDVLKQFPAARAKKSSFLVRQTRIKLDDGKQLEIRFGVEKLREIKYHVGLQIFIAALENRNIIKYITFLNNELKVIADTDPTRVDTYPDKLEYQDALFSDASYFFLNDDVMDIIQPFHLDGQTKGVFKIGFPTTEINKIHRNTVRNTFIFSGWFMFLTIVVTLTALRFQSIYLSKNELIEKQQRQNQFLMSLANLAAGVAHEVRNPLNSISMTIQRLQFEFVPDKEEEKEEYIHFTTLMKNEVVRINSIITEFLGFSRPFKPDPSRFVIDEFLNQVIELFEPEASARGVKVITKFRHQQTSYVGDQNKLNQVLVNLLKNSLDACRKGCSIQMISEIVKGNTWRITVEDNGKGISRDKLDHIFDIYFTTKEDGTGLGLYISRKIILAHGGSIQLTPRTRGGTRAVIVLPIKSQE